MNFNKDTRIITGLWTDKTRGTAPIRMDRIGSDRRNRIGVKRVGFGASGMDPNLRGDKRKWWESGWRALSLSKRERESRGGEDWLIERKILCMKWDFEVEEREWVTQTAKERKKEREREREKKKWMGFGFLFYFILFFKLGTEEKWQRGIALESRVHLCPTGTHLVRRGSGWSFQPINYNLPRSLSLSKPFFFSSIVHYFRVNMVRNAYYIQTYTYFFAAKIVQ